MNVAWEPGDGVDDAMAWSDARCLRGLRDGEEGALDVIVNRYGKRLARTAWMMLRDADAADEVAQDALVAAWHGAAAQTGPATQLRPWLFGILINRCRHWLRSEARRQRHEQVAAEMRPATVDATNATETDVLAEALETLDPALREVVVLRFYEDLSIAETAAVLETKPGTVKSRTSRALAKLRDALAGPAVPLDSPQPLSKEATP